MKTIISVKTILILLLVISCSSMAHAQTLVLWHADGTTTDIELFTKPLVRFDSNKFLVTSSVLDIEYDAKDVLRFTYKGKSTQISDLKTTAKYTQKDGRVIIHGISATDKIALYKANGVRVPVHIFVSGSDAILSLEAIPSGVYLLSVNGKTSKFTKQ